MVHSLLLLVAICVVVCDDWELRGLNEFGNGGVIFFNIAAKAGRLDTMTMPNKALTASAGPLTLLLKIITA